MTTFSTKHQGNNYQSHRMLAQNNLVTPLLMSHSLYIREECQFLHGKPPHNNDRPRHTTNMTQNKNDILSIPNAKDGSSQSVTSTAPLEQTIMTTFSTKHQGNNYQPLLLLLLSSY